ncbi:YybH family protein [Pseudonocardia pini]|uniref:YybH family protein n=1 Tax=Pseudonocardia pini TaxID=2758030 RepID=UPI0015F118B8|nr:SgcJ/EcaC family oxidoreductase [Pseudonocardia pini]
MTVHSPAPTVSDPTDHTADVAAIRQVVADVETGMNTNDPELLTRHFAANAVAVGVNGRPNVGLAALREAHTAAVGPGGFLRDQYVRYEVADVTFVRPDVALARKLARAITEDGEPIDLDHAMSALYVLVKEQERWWVVARQNTLIPS